MNHIKYHIFLLSNIALLGLVNFVLPKFVGIESYGEYNLIIAMPMVISGSITYYFDLISTRVKFSDFFNDLKYRLITCLLILLIVFSFIKINILIAFFTLLNVLLPAIIINLYKQEKFLNLFFLVIINWIIYLLWAIFWIYDYLEIINITVLRDFLIVSFLILILYFQRIHKSSDFLKFNLSDLFDINYLSYAIFDQSKLWIVFLYFGLSDFDSGSIKILLSLAFALVSLLPLNQASLNYVRDNNEFKNALIFSRVLFFSGVIITFLFREIINNFFMSFYGISIINNDFFILLLSIYLFRIISIHLMNSKGLMPLVLLLIFTLIIATNFIELEPIRFLLIYMFIPSIVGIYKLKPYFYLDYIIIILLCVGLQVQQ